MAESQEDAWGLKSLPPLEGRGATDEFLAERNICLALPSGVASFQYFSNIYPLKNDGGNTSYTFTYLPLAYYWVDTRARNGVPCTALHGGTDSDGDTIYVGRAYHDGDWLPAKVIPNKDVAYVAHNGREHAKYEFQVLCEQRFRWVHSSGGYIPEHAVEGGRTGDGEPLYIGRAHHHGSLTVGKVHPSHGCCYIPYGGEEISHREYEILVLDH